MINSQYIMKNTTFVVLAAVLVIAASLSMVAFADEYDERPVVEYDTDDMENPDVPFNSLVEVTGTDIDEEEDYELLDENEDVVLEVTSTDEGVIELDTQDLDGEDDPRGEYEITDADGTEFSANWTLVTDVPSGDVRVEHDAFDSVSTDRVWVGQDVIFADDSLVNGENYDLERVVDDDETELITQLTAEESDTVNNNQLVYNSSADELGVDDATGEFKIMDDSEVIKEWTAQEQTVDGEVNETFVNLNTQYTDVDLNVTSTRAGPYDVELESEQLDAEELEDLIDEDRMGDDMSIETVYDDDGDEHEDKVRVNGIRTSGNNADTIPLDFQGVDEDTYEFMGEVVDADAEFAVTGDDGVSAEVGSSASAQFNEITYTQEKGDTVEMIISMDGTDEAVFNMSDDNYDLEFVVEDTDSSGDVTMEFDTYRAGDHETLSVDDVFDIHEGGEIMGTDDREAEDIELPSVSDYFGTGVYTMELYVNDRDTDLSALNIVDRESVEINTWVLPQDRTNLDLNDLSEYGTQQDKVAEQDYFVVEVESSGMFSNTLFTNETEPHELIDYERNEYYDDFDDYVDAEGLDDAEDMSEFNLHIEEKEPERNDKATHMLVEEAEELEIDPDENSFYLFFDTGNEDIYSTFDDDFDVTKHAEFDVDFSVTDDYKYVDEDDDSADLHEDFELVEREIIAQLPSVDINEEELENRHGVAVSENTTITGETYIAPHTRHIDIQLRDEPGTTNESVEFTETNQTVSEEGHVTASFDTSELELDRMMNLRFVGVDETRRDVVTIEAQDPPEITDVSANTPVTLGEEVEFGVDVDSFDNDSLSYSWDFDDGSTSGASEPVHVYESSGTYDVEVTVTDSEGQTDTGSVEVLVEEAPNQPPTIEQILAPSELEVDEEGSFGAFASDDTDEQDDLTYTWSMDDGTELTGSSVSHAFSVDGVYTVELTVTDSDGESTSETTTVEVTGDSDDGESDTSELEITATDSETEETLPSVTFDILQDGETVEEATTDDNGVATADLEDGSYDVTAELEGYESYSQNIDVDGEDVDFNAVLVSESAGDDDGEDDPSQPGFTIVLAAISMIVGSIIYRYKN